MKFPELILVDSRGGEESLHLFEVWEVNDERLDSIAEDICLALHRVAQDKSKGALAEIHSMIGETVFSLMESGVALDDAVTLFFDVMKKRVQKFFVSKSGEYSFKNEDIFSLLNESRKNGIKNDVEWCKKEFVEPLENNQTRQIYTNGDLDRRYAIDFLEAIWEVSIEGDLSLLKVDLVQTKSTGKRVSGGERDDIIRKHNDFVKDKHTVLAELRQVEVTMDQVEKFKNVLGNEFSKYIEESVMEALTKPSGEALKYFLSTLEAFKNDVILSEHFRKSSKSIKRGFVESLSITNEEWEISEDFSNLDKAFITWKEGWLSTIGEKKKKILLPIHPITIRSVIYVGDEESEVNVLRN